MTRMRRISTWVLALALALFFSGAGVAKLAGQPEMVSLFDRIGAGQWFRYVTGAVELSSAIMLLVPRLATIGGFLLGATMVAAVGTHLLVIGGSPLPAAVAGTACAVLAALRWPDSPLRRREFVS